VRAAQAAVHGDQDPDETREWLEALEVVVKVAGPERSAYILQRLEGKAARLGLGNRPARVTPYCNTIGLDAQPQYPGNLNVEERITSIGDARRRPDACACRKADHDRRLPNTVRNVSASTTPDHRAADMNLDRTDRSYRFYALRLHRQCRRNDRRRFIQHNNRNERRRLSLLPDSISSSPCEQHIRIDAVLSRELCD
jgi:hypothetical protein